MLNLNKQEAAALDRELRLCRPSPELDTVRDKLARIMVPEAPPVIPGQTDIYEQLEDAA